MEKILIVEDEIKLNELIHDYLLSLGYETVRCYDGNQAVAICSQSSFSLIVLDIMLPGLDGIEVTRRIRSTMDVPIIMLTARDAEADKLLGLEIGADDYLTKPFSLRELAARIRAILRRSQSLVANQSSNTHIVHHSIQLNAAKRQVLKNGQEIHLTSAQFELLRCLLQAPGRVFSRRELIESISAYAYEGYERTIDVQVKNLRKTLEDDPTNPSLILTVWGVGYKAQE